VVEAAQPDPLDGLVALAARVAVAVVAEDQASGAPGGDGVAADTALETGRHTATETQHPIINNVLVSRGPQLEMSRPTSLIEMLIDVHRTVCP